METRILHIFLEVVRCGSFAAAARALEQDPSTISRSIALLEQEIGARLLQRTTRHLALTEAGSRFLERIEPIVAELSAACEEAHAVTVQPKGRLRISASVAFGEVCLMPHVAAFLKKHPGIVLDVQLTDRNIDLVMEHVDLAIRLGPAVDADVICSKLMQTRYRICASPDYISRCGAPNTPADLSEHAVLCLNIPGYKSRWLFRNQKGVVTGMPVRPRLIVSSALSLRHAALCGIGPAMLADWLADEPLRTGALVDLFPRYDVAAITFDTAAWLIYPSRSFLPRKTRVAIDFLKDIFQN